MLLEALHQYAVRKKLLDNLPFQTRTVYWLVPLKADGSPRGNGFIKLTTPLEPKGEEPGKDWLLPRFPGDNNGGKAYYLAESFHCVFGVRKDSGETLPTSETETDRNPIRAFQHFWRRIEEAAKRTNDSRLNALLAFRTRHLPEVEGTIQLFDWLSWRPNESSREGKPEWHGQTDTGEWRPLAKLGTVAFEIDDQFLMTPSDDWRNDPIWRDWETTFLSESFRNDEESGDDSAAPSASANTICLVTGAIGQPVARSHKPKILGVPGLTSGGYLVSFAKDSPAFSSYGFEMGANAPVSEKAAASYALGLNDLLEKDDTHFRVGGAAFCFWGDDDPQGASAIGKQIQSAPRVRMSRSEGIANRQVKKFLRAPFAGQETCKPKGTFFSVALSANAGRVVVCDWIRVPLAEATANFETWFEDLDIASFGDAGNGEEAGPYSLSRLAYAVLPKSPGEKGDSARSKARNRYIQDLYAKAIRGAAPSLALLSPMLEAFQTALVTDNPKQNKRTYPLSQSRFALFKLILIRNPGKGEFMPKVYLATDSPDQAYNLGRLLAIFAQLQKKAHEGKLEGPGVVQRYYAGASSSPQTVFPILINLHIHHLRKLEQLKGSARLADSFRAKIGDVLKMFPPGVTGAPNFPSVLTLEEQARFALGYYQQDTRDRVASRVHHFLNEARKAHKDKDFHKAETSFQQAKDAVEDDDYPDLHRRVSAFQFDQPETHEK